jgi:hypothetical protein
MIVVAGATDVSTYFTLTTSATGAALTGATITNIDLIYTRSGSDHAAKVDATALAAVNSAHSDNTAIEIDATVSPGLYRIDWPDAAFAVGVREVILTVLYTGAYLENLRVELSPAVDVKSWDGTAVHTPALAGVPYVDVHNWNGTAVSAPSTAGIVEVNVKNIANTAAAVPGANGGLQICGSNAAATYATFSVTGQMDAGNLLIDGTTVLTGATTLSGDVTVAEEVVLSKSLAITGTTTLASLSVTGALDAGSVLVDGTTVLTGTVGTGALTAQVVL